MAKTKELGLQAKKPPESHNNQEADQRAKKRHKTQNREMSSPKQKMKNSKNCSNFGKKDWSENKKKG